MLFILILPYIFICCISGETCYRPALHRTRQVWVKNCSVIVYKSCSNVYLLSGWLTCWLRTIRLIPKALSTYLMIWKQTCWHPHNSQYYWVSYTNFHLPPICFLITLSHLFLWFLCQWEICCIFICWHEHTVQCHYKKVNFLQIAHIGTS